MPRQTETALGIASDIRADYKPVTSPEWFGGMFILVIGGLVAYGMHLWHKTKSPTAQAEATLKMDLNNELSELKGSFNNKHADLDKRLSLNEQEVVHVNARMNNFEMNLNQQFTGLHKRLNKFEETVMAHVLEK